MKEKDSKKKYPLGIRILAVIGLVIIIFLIIGMIICAITNSKYFYGFLFGAIIFPIVLYIIIWFAGVIKGMGTK